MTQTMSKDEAEIRQLVEDWNTALAARDLDGIVARYTDTSVLYDLCAGGKIVGKAAMRALWEKCLPYFPERFASHHTDMSVHVAGDAAFLHALHYFTSEPEGHPCTHSTHRVTAGYVRIGGQWFIQHEHVSLPFDPMSGKVILLDRKGEAQNPAMGCEAKNDLAAHPVPEALLMQPITPHLVVKGGHKALGFYAAALGAKTLTQLDGPNGLLMHATLEINGARVMLSDEFPGQGNASPLALGGTPIVTHLVVQDCDAAVHRAQTAGAKVIVPAADMFWGDRYGQVEDPFGHRWSFGQPKRAVTPAEMAEAMKAMGAPGCG